MPSAWLLGLGRPKAAAGMLALLVAFSGVYGIHRLVGFSPECACLGEIVRMEIVRKMEDHLLICNGVLIMSLAFGMLLVHAAPRNGVRPA